MSTAEKLTSILNSKTAIKNAIELKGVTVGEAPLANYASLIGQIETGGSSSSSPSSGPATDLFLAFNNNFNVGGNCKYIIIKGQQTNEMDWEAASWGGNFTSDPDFGYVLTLPNQDETEEWERAAYAVKIPFNLWTWIQENSSWTVEFWHKPGNNYNTYSQSSIFGADETSDGGFQFHFSQENTRYNFQILGANGTAYFSGNANSWNHIAVVCDEGTISFYLNGERKVNNYTMPSEPSQYYIPNKGASIGFTSTSDYRDYSIAKLRLSNIARYTGATFTPSKSYTAD